MQVQQFFKDLAKKIPKIPSTKRDWKQPKRLGWLLLIAATLFVAVGINTLFFGEPEHLVELAEGVTSVNLLDQAIWRIKQLTTLLITPILGCILWWVAINVIRLLQEFVAWIPKSSWGIFALFAASIIMAGIFEILKSYGLTPGWVVGFIIPLFVWDTISHFERLDLTSKAIRLALLPVWGFWKIYFATGMARNWAEPMAIIFATIFIVGRVASLAKSKKVKGLKFIVKIKVYLMTGIWTVVILYTAKVLIPLTWEVLVLYSNQLATVFWAFSIFVITAIMYMAELILIEKPNWLIEEKIIGADGKFIIKASQDMALYHPRIPWKFAVPYALMQMLFQIEPGAFWGQYLILAISFARGHNLMIKKGRTQQPPVTSGAFIMHWKWSTVSFFGLGVVLNGVLNVQDLNASEDIFPTWFHKLCHTAVVELRVAAYQVKKIKVLWDTNGIWCIDEDIDGQIVRLNEEMTTMAVFFHFIDDAQSDAGIKAGVKQAIAFMPFLQPFMDAIQGLRADLGEVKAAVEANRPASAQQSTSPAGDPPDPATPTPGV